MPLLPLIGLLLQLLQEVERLALAGKLQEATAHNKLSVERTMVANKVISSDLFICH